MEIFAVDEQRKRKIKPKIDYFKVDLLRYWSWTLYLARLLLYCCSGRRTLGYTRQIQIRRWLTIHSRRGRRGKKKKDRERDFLGDCYWMKKKDFQPDIGVWIKAQLRHCEKIQTDVVDREANIVSNTSKAGLSVTLFDEAKLIFNSLARFSFFLKNEPFDCRLLLFSLLFETFFH